MRRVALVLSLAVTVSAWVSGIAFGVSDGNYDPARQGCTADADNHNTPGAQSGCANYRTTVSDGAGRRYVDFGLDQVADHTNVHSAFVRVDPNGDGTGPVATLDFDTNWQPFAPDSCGVFDLAFFAIGLVTGDGCTIDAVPPSQSSPPTVAPGVQPGTPNGNAASLLTEAHFYNGADDNMNTGEHDGTDPTLAGAEPANGPSDGGAIVVNWHPMDVMAWLGAVMGPDGAHAVLTNPVALADAGMGSCADGVCMAIQTRERAVWHGGANGETRQVYDYEGKDWDPEACSSASDADQAACHGDPGHPQTMNEYKNADAQDVVAEPGVQVFEDPDPAGSPIGPYPLPAAYAGTCGVALGGGPLDFTGAPMANGAGQIIVSTGC